MNFTQTQITEILDEIANGKNGYQELLKLSLESIMRSERDEFNNLNSDVANGYRYSSVLGHGGKLGCCFQTCVIRSLFFFQKQRKNISAAAANNTTN